MYRAALIGCGNIGSGYDRDPKARWSFTHAGAYRLAAGVRLVAAADPSKKARTSFLKKWGIDQTFQDHRRMLEEIRPDIVSIALPTELHARAFKDSLALGAKAVFLEKPLARKLSEARQIVRAAKGHLVQVNYFRRWNPTLLKLREDLRSGTLGRSKSAVFRYTKGLYGNASHFIDLARLFWGEPTSVVPYGKVSRTDGDPGADFALRFKGGLTAHFLHVPDPGFVFFDADILTTKGRVVIGQRGQTLEKHRTALEPHYRMFKTLRRVSEKETDWRVSMKEAVSGLVRCLKNGGRPRCTVEDGLRVVEICRRAEGVKNR